ncbi:MAG: ATPase, T2SS/T4P/T4SS family [archaeon]
MSNSRAGFKEKLIFLQSSKDLPSVDFLTRNNAEKQNLLRSIQNILFAGGMYSTKEEVVMLSYYIYGLGPLQPFYEMPDVNEIIVQNGKIRIEQNGKIKDTQMTLTDEEAEEIIRKVAESTHNAVGINRPLLSCELPNSQDRFIGILPPITVHPQINIRIRTNKYYKIEELVAFNMLSSKMAEFLIEMVKVKANILVTGIGSSGKTTLVDALLPFIPDDSITVIVEDVRELHLHKSNITSFVPNIERERTQSEELTEKIDISSLINLIGNRVRADRVILGEVRTAEEVKEFLNTLSIGSNGVITTMHSNSSLDALNRIENLVADVYKEPRIVRSILGPNLDIIVQTERVRDYFRVVKSIDLLEYDYNTDKYQIIEVFKTSIEHSTQDKVVPEFIPRFPEYIPQKIKEKFEWYYGFNDGNKKINEIFGRG